MASRGKSAAYYRRSPGTPRYLAPGIDATAEASRGMHVWSCLIQSTDNVLPKREGPLLSNGVRDADREDDKNHMAVS
jgi:hypothetical protein